ncbi:MAG TPA: glycosyltransferase family 4 protein [Candidatus Saccharimonadales bacterium]
MISFVWSSKQPFLAGRGGSENYTAGQIRELMRRGIPTRVLTLGFGEEDGRDDWPDIQFKALKSKAELSELGDTLIFVTYPIDVPTKRQSYVILHCPQQRLDPPLDIEALDGKYLITTSRFASKLWGKTLHTWASRIPTAYPFAEDCFREVERPAKTDSKTRILFAGRLLPDKGIYTLLASLHMESMKQHSYEVTVTDAASETEDGQVILRLLHVHPKITVVPARKTPGQMAQLMAQHDIVVVPSTNSFWQEIFGIVSVEAQHAGCRVVASNGGGLPETDCGGLMLVKPDDPAALASGLAKAALLGPLTAAERMYAGTKFTRKASVDKLLKIINTVEKTQTKAISPIPLLQKQGSLVREQLDVALGTLKLGQLGLQFGREQKLAQRNIRNT